MNSFKSLLTVAILAAVGVGLYLKINSMPDPKPPKDFSSSWVEPPAIDMAGMDTAFGGAPDASSSTSTTGAAGGAAPAYDPGPAGGTAPVYVPPTGSGNPPPIEDQQQTSGNAEEPEGLSQSGKQPDSLPVSVNMEIPPGANGMPADIPNNPATGGTTNPFAAHVSGGHAQSEDRYGSPASEDYTQGPGGLDSSTPHEHVNVTQPDPNQFNAGMRQQMPTTTSTSESLLYQKEHAQFDQAWAEARTLLAQQNLPKAHLLLSSWYNDPTLTAVEREALLDLLSGLAGTVLYSRGHYLEQPYTPAAGETLEQIARRYQVSAELLAKINGISDPDRLSPEQPLKVLRGPFGAMIDTEQHEMVLVVGGRYAGRFEVGFGREQQDIVGRYEVIRKAVNPPYWGPDKTIEPGDPNNPFGTHFIRLAKPLQNEAVRTFGIHGTNLTGNLQADEARGFIRVSQREVADCYDILVEKSPVLIR